MRLPSWLKRLRTRLNSEMVSTKPYIVFPGNLQGRHVRESGEKGAVMVSVTDGVVGSVERIIVDRARWADLSVDVNGFTSEAAILKEIEEKVKPLASVAAERLVALRVECRGERPECGGAWGARAGAGAKLCPVFDQPGRSVGERGAVSEAEAVAHADCG